MVTSKVRTVVEAWVGYNDGMGQVSAQPSELAPFGPSTLFLEKIR